MCIRDREYTESLLRVSIPVDTHSDSAENILQPSPQLFQLPDFRSALLLNVSKLGLQLSDSGLLLSLRGANPRKHGDKVLDLLFLDNEIARKLPLPARKCAG